MATAADHLASAPSMEASSIFQPWGMKAPKITGGSAIAATLHSRPRGTPASEWRQRPRAESAGPVGSSFVWRGAEVTAVVVAVLTVGLAGPAAVGRATAEAPAPAAELGATIDQVAVELANLDSQVSQLQIAVEQVDAELVRAKSSRDALREQSTDRERLQAQLIAQARPTRCSGTCTGRPARATSWPSWPP